MNQSKNINVDYKQKVEVMEELLKTHKQDGVYHTHVSMGQRRGKYNFNRDGLESFWSIYDTESRMGMAEKPQQYLPVLGDIDIKVLDEGQKSLHSQKQINEVITAYQSVLKKIVKDYTKKTLICLLLTKPLYSITKNNNTYLKHGFHLHFPYCFLSKSDQEVHLIPRVKALITEQKTFLDSGFEDSGKMIDAGICNVPWLVYGCVKDTGMMPYKLSKCFDFGCNEVDINTALKDYPLFDKQEKLININNNIVPFLPRILSIIPYNRKVSELVFGLESPIKNKLIEQRKEKTEYTSSKEDRDIVTKLMSCLSDDRSDDRSDWLKIGWMLNTIFEGSEEGMNMWCKFSGRCEEKYDEAVCIHMWDKMENKGELTIGTLKYYAKLDNPEMYKEITQTHDDTYNIPEHHSDIAELFKQQYGDDNIRIICKKKGVFYKWDTKKLLWIKEENCTLLRLIKECIMPDLQELGRKILDEIVRCTDKGEEAMYNAKYKQVYKSINNMKSTPFLNNVVKYYLSFDIDKQFTTKIDRSPHELPIKDGQIINLKTLETRPRTPFDLFSFELDVSYQPNTKFTNVIKFFKSLSEDDDDLVDYHRRLWGYSLTGEITDRSLHVLYGGGMNGKSTLMNIMEKIMKGYYTGLSEAVMMKQDNRSGSATPELMALMSSRLGVLPESDKQEILNSKRVKSITGADIIKGRALYSDEISFRTQTKPIMPTNHKPLFNIDDQAMIDRIKLLSFNARFPTMKEDKQKFTDNHKFINHLMDNCIDEIFTWFVTGSRDWYGGDLLIPCEAMKSSMDSYLEDLDDVAMFVKDVYDTKSKIEYAKLAKNDKALWRVKKSDVYGEYMGWCSEQQQKTLSKKDFNKRIEKHVQETKTDGLRCFICKTKESNYDEDENNILPPL